MQGPNEAEDSETIGLVGQTAKISEIGDDTAMQVRSITALSRQRILIGEKTDQFETIPPEGLAAHSSPNPSEPALPGLAPTFQLQNTSSTPEFAALHEASADSESQTQPPQDDSATNPVTKDLDSEPSRSLHPLTAVNDEPLATLPPGNDPDSDSSLEGSSGLAASKPISGQADPFTNNSNFHPEHSLHPLTGLDQEPPVKPPVSKSSDGNSDLDGSLHAFAVVGEPNLIPSKPPSAAKTGVDQEPSVIKDSGSGSDSDLDDSLHPLAVVGDPDSIPLKPPSAATTKKKPQGLFLTDSDLEGYPDPPKIDPQVFPTL